MGLLCSHSRLHGSNSYRVPWLIDNPDASEQEAASSRQKELDDPLSSTSVLQRFIRLKRSLMPYLYSQAVESARNAWPLSLRAMALEFPADPTAWFLDRQFMIGESILAAPVFTEEGDVEFYLPVGKWTSWWSGEVVTGPGWRQEKHNVGSLPLYVRENTILLVGKDEGSGFGDDWLAAGGEVRLYYCQPGAKATVVNIDGSLVGVVEVTIKSLESSDQADLNGIEALGKQWEVKAVDG